MAKSINMVWGTHIARVKTKNILNLRKGLFKAPLSYVELIFMAPPFCAPPLPVGGFGGASFGTGFATTILRLPVIRVPVEDLC